MAVVQSTATQYEVKSLNTTLTDASSAAASLNHLFDAALNPYVLAWAIALCHSLIHSRVC